jgi:hypothetical protein
MTPLLELARIMFHHATGASASRSSLTVLPPFRHDFQNRNETHDVNIFLVAINADIKFRRYFKMIQQQPPTTALPADVLMLMRRVVELVDLLYWAPVPTKGSKGEEIRAERMLLKRKNPERAGRSSEPQYAEMSSEESGMEDSLTLAKSSRGFRRLDWLPDVEARRAYGSALMCGHGIPSFLFDQ